MMEQPFISGTMVRALLRFFDKQNLDISELCRQVGLSEAVEVEADQQFPAVLYRDLLQTAIGISGDTALGLRFGMAAEADRWGVVGYIMSCSRTVAEAMHSQQRYQNLVGSIGTLDISPCTAGLRLSWITKQQPFPAMAEEAVAGWVKFGRWMTDTDLSPSRVCFCHSPQTDPAEYEQFFSCDVAFEADFNGLEIPADFLQLPLRQPDAQMHNWLQLHADEKLEQLAPAPELLRRLQSYVEMTLPRQVPDLSEAAAALELSKRALQRRLGQHQTNYKKFLEQTRKSLAKHYLLNSSLSIVEITFLLGFSEQSAFTRAFKRWYGMSPGEFRKTSITA